MTLDADSPDPRIVAQIVKIYEQAATRLRDAVLHPPGSTAGAQLYNQTRAAQQLGRIEQILKDLRSSAADWTGHAIRAALTRGQRVGVQQIKALGVEPTGLSSAFAGLDRGAVARFAQDTAADLIKAADSMANVAGQTLRRMAATGVSNAEVNQILAGRWVIEGKPDAAIRELKISLEKVHGKTVEVIDKNGDPLTFDTGYYASMVASTKTREATVSARHQTLSSQGLDLVIVVGRDSKNFCTAYMGHVFSLSGHDAKYPPLASTPGGGPPYHPNCSKSTAPYIDGMASAAQRAAVAPTEALQKMLGSNDRNQLQRQFQGGHYRGMSEDRQRSIIQDIRDRARANGYEPPAYGRPAPPGDQRAIR